MSALRTLPRLAGLQNKVVPRAPLRLVRGSCLNLSLLGDRPKPWTVSEHFHNTAIRRISQAAKDKVNESWKPLGTVDDRAKKVIIEQLNAKPENVSKCFLPSSHSSIKKDSFPCLYILCGGITLHSLTQPMCKVHNWSTLADLKADSLDKVELIIALEEEFDIVIRDEENFEEMANGRSWQGWGSGHPAYNSDTYYLSTSYDRPHLRQVGLKALWPAKGLRSTLLMLPGSTASMETYI